MLSDHTNLKFIPLSFVKIIYKYHHLKLVRVTCYMIQIYAQNKCESSSKIYLIYPINVFLTYCLHSPKSKFIQNDYGLL